MKNKNILITGGAGFIGSHIANELMDNNDITIIDNLSTGNIKNLKSEEHENLNFIEGDICNFNLDDLTSDKDYIFHLAAMASVPLSVERPEECNEINLNATVRLLKSAADNDVEKIVFSSSSAVYGENKNMPLKETEPPMPTSPYAASKAGCELYLKSFYESYGLNYTALRYFNVFGPKQDKNSQYAAVIPNFISALLEGKRAEIYGDGEQTRDFVYVGDVVKANINACESDYNGIVNIASGEKLTVNRLYGIVKNTLGSDLEPEYLPERPGDIKHSLADVSNMEKINLKIDSSDFESQLIETINWFKTIL
ncbi:MAG: NAD-dependent epimerase/dehydratase family protein [Methanobrevibacter thaueri]|uniref:NAD-dependent epimerase/dehydratase family protein n=1 Tax=Methanobrevibacter thaueri TaxID=190975 RepID=A0A8T3VFY8_9EURY|nr:NAD-dependent epimerase/dehydratase family protein [Methanobrevibacter thaueri]MBE6501518.1 NAD-dependent epimerase/dehydratase family protein [Methanobrevibacter thaueri]